MNSISCHGVFLEIFNLGVFLTGPSGIGKSEIALSLINNGHALIADDMADFTLNPSSETPELIGSCPPLLQDYLEVRGLGIINIRAMFGDQAINNQKPLELIVDLEIMDKAMLLSLDRITGKKAPRKMLGVDITEVCLPVLPGRNFAILVEAAVRNQLLKLRGFDAAQDFIRNQKEQLQ